MFFDFVTQELLTEEAAKQITKPYWVELTEVWSEAWRLYKKIPEETRGRIDRVPVAKATNLNAIAGTIVQDCFAGRESEGLEVCTKLQFVKLYITRNVVLRFNALTPGLIVRNINASPQKATYFRQEPLSGIWPGATRLTAGYVADPARADLARVAMSLQIGDVRVYSFFIDGQEDAAIPIPAKTSPPTVPSAQTYSEKLRKRTPR